MNERNNEEESRFWIIAAVLARALGTALADVVSPPSCAACDARLAKRAIFCGACAQTIEPPEIARASALAAASFGGAVATAIKRFKYEGRSDLARPLSEMLRGAIARSRFEGSIVVPVPLHPRRLAERGYNQAALLAAPIARHLGVPFAARALVRVRDTPMQASLGRLARGENVAGAFVARRALPNGARVLLVDDVATTGATLAACAAALIEAGARSVTTLVVARTDAASTLSDAAARSPDAR